MQKTCFSVILYFVLFCPFSLQTEINKDSFQKNHYHSDKLDAPPQEALDRLYAKIEPLINKYSKQDITELLNKSEYFSSESFLYPILHAQEIKNHAIRAFRDKLLYQLDTYGVLPGIPALGIYTKDIISLLLYGSLLLDEKLLLHIYSEYIVDHAVDYILQTQAPAQNPSSTENTHTFLLTLVPPVFQSFQSNIKHIATSRCLTSHAWHAVLSLLIDACKKHYLLNEEHAKFFSSTKTSYEPKSLLSLVQETLLVEIPLNIPDATVIHTAIHALSSYNLLSPLCHNALLQASKNIIGSLLFLYYFSTKIMLPMWHKLLQKNHEQIIKLLKNYHDPQANQEARASIKNRLKQLIATHFSTPYTTWLKEKHRYLTRLDACFYAFFLIPVVYKGGSWLYNIYKAVTQETTQGTTS